MGLFEFLSSVTAEICAMKVSGMERSLTCNISTSKQLRQMPCEYGRIKLMLDHVICDSCHKCQVVSLSLSIISS